MYLAYSADFALWSRTDTGSWYQFWRGQYSVWKQREL